MKDYDIIIIGAGPAGIMAAKRISKDLSVLMLESGKDILHRKDLISGWFGHGLFSLDKIDILDSSLKNQVAVRESFRIVKKILNINPEISKIDGIPKSQYCLLPQDAGMKIATYFSETLSKKVDIIYNLEILSVVSEEDSFVVKSYNDAYKCKKCIIATGKNSFNFINNLCKTYNINSEQSYAKIGIRIEIPNLRDALKNYYKMQPKYGEKCEDIHIDSLVSEWEDSDIISAQNRNTDTKSGKINFFIKINDCTLQDAIRNIQIINVLANDKLKIERVADYMEGKSILQHLDIFNILHDIFRYMDSIIPSFIRRGLMYIPEIRFKGILPVDKNMKTEIRNLYGIGECTNKVHTTLGAMASGIIVSKTILKE
jgi:hypothetical protein